MKSSLTSVSSDEFSPLYFLWPQLTHRRCQSPNFISLISLLTYSSCQAPSSSRVMFWVIYVHVPTFVMGLAMMLAIRGCLKLPMHVVAPGAQSGHHCLATCKGSYCKGVSQTPSASTTSLAFLQQALLTQYASDSCPLIHSLVQSVLSSCSRVSIKLSPG